MHAVGGSARSCASPHPCSSHPLQFTPAPGQEPWGQLRFVQGTAGRQEPFALCVMCPDVERMELLMLWASCRWPHGAGRSQGQDDPLKNRLLSKQRACDQGLL